MCTHITASAVHSMSGASLSRNSRKNLWLSSPTHVSSHGQWWSNLRTHRPQSSQCFALIGCCNNTRSQSHWAQLVTSLVWTSAYLRAASFRSLWAGTSVLLCNRSLRSLSNISVSMSHSSRFIYTERKPNAKAKFFLWSLSLLSVDIKLVLYEPIWKRCHFRLHANKNEPFNAEYPFDERKIDTIISMMTRFCEIKLKDISPTHKHGLFVWWICLQIIKFLLKFMHNFLIVLPKPHSRRAKSKTRFLENWMCCSFAFAQCECNLGPGNTIVISLQSTNLKMGIKVVFKAKMLSRSITVNEPWGLRVHLYLRKSESNVTSRWVHRESNLIFTLSNDKDQRKQFAFAYDFSQCEWTLIYYIAVASYVNATVAALSALALGGSEHLLRLVRSLFCHSSRLSLYFSIFHWSVLFIRITLPNCFL